MTLGVLTYDYQPPIGGLGVIAHTYVELLRKLNPQDPVVVLSPSPASDDRLSRLGRWRFATSGGCPLFSVMLFWSLCGAINRHRISSLLVHAGSGGVFLLHKPPCHVVVMAHHTYLQEVELVYRSRFFKSLWKRLMALLERRTYRLADHIVCVSRDTADALVHGYGIDAAKITVIEHPVREASSHASALRSSKTILFIGRLEERKGITVLLKAVALVRARHPQVSLRLAGKNLMGDALATAIDSLALRGHVTLLGQISASLIERERDDATMLVVPSLLEGFGLVAADGLMSGIPVIASDCPGLRSLIRDGETGLLFKSGNSDDLAAKIMLLLEDADLLQRMADQAKSDALVRFDPEARASDLIEVLRRK